MGREAGEYFVEAWEALIDDHASMDAKRTQLQWLHPDVIESKIEDMIDGIEREIEENEERHREEERLEVEETRARLRRHEARKAARNERKARLEREGIEAARIAHDEWKAYVKTIPNRRAKGWMSGAPKAEEVPPWKADTEEDTTAWKEKVEGRQNPWKASTAFDDAAWKAKQRAEAFP